MQTGWGSSEANNHQCNLRLITQLKNKHLSKLPHLRHYAHLVYISVKVITMVATYYEYILCQFCQPKMKVHHHLWQIKMQVCSARGSQCLKSDSFPVI